jgi:plastocyanin
MGIRKGLTLAAALALGAAVAVLPAVASSESVPQIEAENAGIYEHRWKPPSATVAEGGSVALSNPTAVAHGVEWRSGPEKPTCTSGVPVGESAEHSATNWSGTCTFRQPGVYVFWCTVHRSYMSATVTVQPATTTTGTTGTTPGGTTGTSSGGGGGGTNASPPVPSPATAPASQASPLASAASTAVRVRSRQRGPAVRGSIDLSSAGAGSRVEVDLFASRASLASARSPLARVGRFVRSVAGRGTIAFSVPLSAVGRRALARAGRLVLSVAVKITPRTGKRLVVRRSVFLRA